MKKLYLKELLPVLGGWIEKGLYDRKLFSVTTEQRGIQEHALFFHRGRESFLWESLPKHRSFVLVTDTNLTRKSTHRNCTLVKVRDIEIAYWVFVDWYRGQLDVPVIGITGTCGKSTTKEMVKHILAVDRKVHATYLSNNGVNLNLRYLTGFAEDSEVGVFEMGVAYPGNLRTTCRYFRPQVGVITNIGIDHLHGCKTLEGYIQAKAELLEGLGNEGTLILNSDDHNIRQIDLSGYRGQVCWFGTRGEADFRADEIVMVDGGMGYTLTHQGASHRLYVPGYGEHNVLNALAAIAAAHALGVSVREAGERISTFVHLERHLEVGRGVKGCTLIDDTWSSNPTSAEVALDVTMRLAQSRFTIAVLGRMGLLSESSVEHHKKIGRKVAETGFDLLVVVGKEAEPIAAGAWERGMPVECVYVCSTAEEAYRIIRDFTDEKTVVLVKTSMESSMKELIHRLKGTE